MDRPFSTMDYDFVLTRRIIRCVMLEDETCPVKLNASTYATGGKAGRTSRCSATGPAIAASGSSQVTQAGPAAERGCEAAANDRMGTGWCLIL